MFDRENLVGVVLLAVCAVVGGLLVYAIATGTRFVYTGPEWLGWVLLVLFVGAAVYGWLTSRRRRWPHPQAGWRWPWQRRRDDDRR